MAAADGIVQSDSSVFFRAQILKEQKWNSVKNAAGPSCKGDVNPVTAVQGGRKSMQNAVVEGLKFDEAQRGPFRSAENST